jgi:hypothetical protein
MHDGGVRYPITCTLSQIRVDTVGAHGGFATAWCVSQPNRIASAGLNPAALISLWSPRERTTARARARLKAT